MPRTSLAERMSRLEQQKARLAEQEAKIKADERKQRTKRLVEAGTLIEKSGLLQLDDDALYGALLSLVGAAKDARQLSEWAKAGAKAFHREAATGDAAKEPLTMTFLAALPTPFTTKLRAAGLRWNKVLQHWEGLADYDAVAALAAEQGGTVTRVRSGDGPSKKSSGSKPSYAPQRS